MTRCELLAPAGNLNKLKLAFYYGADAVYVGGKSFSLRTFADNFTDEELAEGIAFAHARGKKVYVAVNIFARNADFAQLPDYFRTLERLGADAVLVSDLGVFRACREAAPSLPIHISTQANTTNSQSAAMWKALGASRVVLARELSLEEIANIHEENPDLELEAFVHGAMCISYSGRCLLSDYLDGRSSNRGACVQACRYRYEIRTQECKNDGWTEVQEDEKGTYFLNSKDLNMSAHLSELETAGVCSFKIEGRMKSEYYLATVVNAYRRILDGGDLPLLKEEPVPPTATTRPPICWVRTIRRSLTTILRPRERASSSPSSGAMMAPETAPKMAQDAAAAYMPKCARASMKATSLRSCLLRMRSEKKSSSPI